MPPRRPTSRRPMGRSGRPADGWWPPPSTPIAVEGGLQARSRRGRIGDTWWSQRFIAVLDTFGIGSRLQRGKRYARTGQVLTMEVTAGQVKASVQGSRAKPYRVFIETDVLTAAEWEAIESVMASSAVFAARLLADEMPEEIEEAFADSSTSLFPASADELDSACSCPDWENPCKHIAAVYYLLAEAFDGDPFLIFAWRGRTKEELLTGLRARRRGSDSNDGPESRAVAKTAGTGPFGWPVADPERIAARQGADSMFTWGADADLAGIETRPRLAVASDLVLRQLDPTPLAADGVRIAEELRALYEAITAGAAALALDEESE
ncbi:MAG TPA: SWIM zinc finger family protein [Acidimicrobiales bacterium]|nr:SWIM zinc finger family protein [Acidimicrobiales bacterium]